MALLVHTVDVYPHPLAYPGYGFGQQQSLTSGTIKLKHISTGATLNYKW